MIIIIIKIIMTKILLPKKRANHINFGTQSNQKENFGYSTVENSIKLD